MGHYIVYILEHTNAGLKQIAGNSFHTAQIEDSQSELEFEFDFTLKHREISLTACLASLNEIWAPWKYSWLMNVENEGEIRLILSFEQQLAVCFPDTRIIRIDELLLERYKNQVLKDCCFQSLLCWLGREDPIHWEQIS